MYLFRAPEWIKKNHRLFSLTFSWWNFDLLTVAWGLPDYISRIGFPSFAKERWFWLTEGSWFSILLQLSNSSHSTIISCTESILCFQCKIWMNLWGAIHPVWRWECWSNIAYGEGREGKKIGSDNILKMYHVLECSEVRMIQRLKQKHKQEGGENSNSRPRIRNKGAFTRHGCSQ